MNINDICVAVVGLGYVGLPLAVAFAKKKYKVIGFDINDKKINKYISGVDPTQEIGNNELPFWAITHFEIPATCHP